MCHAVRAAAIFFEVVAKFCIMATNLLKFSSIGSDGLADVAGFDCAAGGGSMYTGSGLFLGWAVALGFKFMGIG